MRFNLQEKLNQKYRMINAKTTQELINKIQQQKETQKDQQNKLAKRVE